jgi:hypothetical protein
VVAQALQHNLGPVISVAALCSILVAISLPVSAPSNLFVPTVLAAMGYTLHPQLGLMARVQLLSFFGAIDQNRCS